MVEIDGEQGRVTYDVPGPASRMSLLTPSGMPINADEAVLLSVNRTVPTLPVLSSLLSVTLGSQDVSVTCQSNDDTRTTTLHVLGKFIQGYRKGGLQESLPQICYISAA